jgi:hypothetical protein
MADLQILNSSDLKAEILRLRQLREQQGNALKERFESPMVAFSTLMSAFPKGTKFKYDIFNQGFLEMISGILLPLTLNKTIFRNSNFLVKGIVGFLSQKASHLVSEDSVARVLGMVRSLFEKRKVKHEDYGIPPESEAS